MSMCQQFQTYETTNVYAVPYGYEEQKWVSDQDYDLVTLMDVDASMIQTGPAVHQNVEIKNSVKLGRKYLFISLIFQFRKNSIIGFFHADHKFYNNSNESFQFFFQS